MQLKELCTKHNTGLVKYYIEEHDAVAIGYNQYYIIE